MADVELDGITVTFGDVTAVEDVDLHVRDGELLVLVGPSGCGKTTLLRTVAGLESPDEGEVYLDGRRVTDLPARKRDVSLVFQDYALFPHLSAGENVAFDLRMQGDDDVDRRVREVAELLDVGDLLDRSIDELSGGQKQRVALGRAIVTEPSAFLLDEPLANLDATLRERMRTELARLQRRLGVTTVHVTHDQTEALTMGDRVAVVNDGRIEQVASPETIYREPATLFVAGFVGSPTMNRVRGRVDDDGVGLPGGVHLDVVPGERPNAGVVVGVRPEQVEVAVEDGVTGPDDGWFVATVAFEEFHGADRFAYLDAPDLPELLARLDPEVALDVGQQVRVRLPPDRVHLFDAESGERLARSPTPDARETPGGES